MTVSRSLDLYWNPKQSAFLVSTEPFVDLEGGIRAGKSYVLCWKILFACLDYPGIICALTRWTQDGLDAQLRPAWRDVCRQAGMTPSWNPSEEYDELPNGSRVYLRALRASEDTNRYGKLAGLEFTIIGIDQAEEVPSDVYRAYVPGRLSQRFSADKVTPVLHKDAGTPPPKQVLITPNPPANTDHWICTDWPMEGAKPDHVLIRTTMYDNAILGEDYIALQESAYDEGTPEHRRFVLGERGVTTGGDPIFGGQFDEPRHVRSVQFNPSLPLYESIDFGTRRPCVTWQQYWPSGVLVFLGGVMGQNLPLEEFVPIIEEYRADWFPGLNPDLLQHTCDPAGESANNQGSETGVNILNSFGIYPLVKKNGNSPPVKDAAIQKVNGYLMRRTPGPEGSTLPCFLIDPRFVIVGKKGRRHQPVMHQAMSHGYIYDPKRNYIGTNYPHLRPAFKDGFYEHPCDSFLYGVIAFAPADPAKDAGILRTPDAIREAVKIYERAGMTPMIPSGTDPGQWAARVLESRARAARQREEARARREANRDDRRQEDALRRSIARRTDAGEFGQRRRPGSGRLMSRGRIAFTQFRRGGY